MEWEITRLLQENFWFRYVPVEDETKNGKDGSVEQAYRHCRRVICVMHSTGH